MRKIMLILLAVSLCFSGGTAFAATVTINVDQKPALSLQLLDGWKVQEYGRKTSIDPGRYEAHIQIMGVPAKSVADSVPMVAEIIKSEVTEFQVSATNDLTIAGAAAKHLVGTGVKADDGDPSNAEVFIFPVGEKVFLLCAHGEGHGAAKAQADIIAMLNAVKQP